ncbi:hypothetical protein EBL87_15170 [Cereibacter sphaeroides]|uniref:hypothetical protein n=1 Tax=Cereibacter sphaeroides TaxID=1063 RepID=UPI000F547D6E|nr:hypothetical protein [Cereibacter sphaeroides]AZB65015.1 hypothetical protein EBL87_15170 [Cereibacter sphaeroides]AZB67101.1 hypothetical protein EBL86_01240 [Cereibacter sphaeroides]
MKQDLPLSPRALNMARHRAEHAPTAEGCDTASRLLSDHELAIAMGRQLHRAVPRPTFRTSKPSPLGPNLTAFLVGTLALFGFLFVATVLWAHATDVAATMREQAAAMRGM